MITIQVLGNWLLFRMFTESYSHVVIICDIPSWWGTNKDNQESSRESCKLRLCDVSHNDYATSQQIFQPNCVVSQGLPVQSATRWMHSIIVVMDEPLEDPKDQVEDKSSSRKSIYAIDTYFMPQHYHHQNWTVTIQRNSWWQQRGMENSLFI